MLYARYVLAELRRRRGRTVLTALGLGVGVALVVTVSALSRGLDRAQDQVLEPLTGVGTDMSVTRPIKLGAGGGPPGAGLSTSERRQLQRENGGGGLGLQDLGKPGQRFSRARFLTTQLSFPASRAQRVARLAGVKDVAASLTLNAVTVSGRVPKQAPSGGGPFEGGGPGAGPPRSIRFNALSVTGLEATRTSLGPVSPSQLSSGRWFRTDGSREALVNVAYARRAGVSVGDEVRLGGKRFTVVGIVKTPLGGQASDVYVKLDQLQALSGRQGRINVLYVRADDSGGVGAVAKRIQGSFPGSSVTTSKDLADRVGGSLSDARNLSSKLGTALAAVGLAAAFLIACLLTLSSVTKRVSELGTLKALGWPQRLVVRQVTLESLAQGALGGAVGALLGFGGAGLISAIAPKLTASVAQAAARPFAGPFGQGAVTGGSQTVTLHAPVDAALIALAVALALAGGLIAGAVGGLRAARLRPADALRHIG